MRWLLVAASLGVPVLAASRAGAQPGPLIIKPLSARTDTQSTDTLTLDPATRAAIEMTRLSLDATVPDLTGSVGSECGTEGASPTAARWFTTQGATGVRLVPSLTLVGFTQHGCRYDSRVGVVMTYATPITRTVSLTLGSGILYLPNALVQPSNRMRGGGRADVVFELPKNRALSVGVGVFGGRTTVNVGGLF